MIGLTDTQLKIVMSAARSVPVEKREKIVRGRETSALSNPFLQEWDDSSTMTIVALKPVVGRRRVPCIGMVI
jgi:hypothetical protein